MKNSPKHTPGPWELGEYDEYLGYDSMTGGINAGPATLDASDYGQPRLTNGGDITRMEADARLIAAAPEMLDLIKGFLGDGVIDSLPCCCGVCRKGAACDLCRTRALLAKIEGA